MDDKELVHFGVKGMKWGVRKGTLSGKIKPRATLSITDRWEQSWLDNAQSKGYSRVYRKAARKIRGATRQLNNDPKFKGQDFKKDSPLRREYYKAYSDMVTNQLNAAVTARRIVNPLTKAGQSPLRKFELHFNSFDVSKELRPTATIRRTDTHSAKKDISKANNLVRKEVSLAKDLLSKIKHSAEEDDEFPEEGVEVSFIWDDFGHILDLVYPGEEALAQAMDWMDNYLAHKNDEDFLAHYGVLGMRWGFRKRREGVTTVDSKKSSVLTDEELKSRIARIKIEKEYNELKSPKLTAGKRILTGLLVGAATTVASAYLRKYMEKGVDSLISKATLKKGKNIVDAASNKTVTEVLRYVSVPAGTGATAPLPAVLRLPNK